LTITAVASAASSAETPMVRGEAKMIRADAQNNALEIGESGIDLNEMVSSMERNMIRKALEKAGGVRSKAAQLLGINRTTLLEKMKKMGIELQKQ